MLFNCSDCGKLISSHSPECPYCQTALIHTTPSREVFHPHFTKRTNNNFASLTGRFISRVIGR